MRSGFQRPGDGRATDPRRAVILGIALVLSALAFYEVRMAPAASVDRHPEVLPANTIQRTYVPPPARPRLGPAALHRQLASSAAALRGVLSYAGGGSVLDRDGYTSIAVQYVAPDRVDVTWMHKGRAVDLMSLGDQTAFIRATPDYWPRFGLSRSLARRLNGIWVSLGATNAARMARLARQFVPATIAHCLLAAAGTLHDGGTAAADDGAQIIRFAGDVPGGARGLVHVAAKGAPYPTKIAEWGRARGGVPDPRCPAPGSGVRSQILGISSIDQEVTIVPPASAPSFERLAAALHRGRTPS